MISVNSKRVAVGGEGEDRISVLPRHVIDCILEHLPVQDAAKTSVLSKQWRDIWVTLPNLVLDSLFCNKLTAKSHTVFKETIDEILLQHHVVIVKFHLDVSQARLSSFTDINRWMRCVTRSGVEELTLSMSDNITTYKLPSYKLPSYIFNCPTLTTLGLSKCVFKPPHSFLGFSNLITLDLEDIIFVPATDFCVINVPRLVSLTLKTCHNTKCLKIVSPLVESLFLFKIHYLLLNCFMNCKKLSEFGLELQQVVDQQIRAEISTLDKFFLSLAPTFRGLFLGSALLELLSADTVPKGPLFTSNCMCNLQLCIDIGRLSQVSCALQLIKSVPHLRQLTILVDAISNNYGTVMKHLDAPACLDRPLNKLEYVGIKSFQCSKTELLFVKLLLASTPSLVRICIEQGTDTGLKKERNTAIELMRFPRASPMAEIFYYPSSA